MMHNAAKVARRCVARTSTCSNAVQRRTLWTKTPEGLDKIPPEQVVVKNDRSYRIRQNGHEPLPLPPLLDDIVIEAQTRFKTPKPVQRKRELTDFQQQLENNAYAHALASKIRTCRVTQARVPEHFLMPMKTELIPDADSKDKTKPLVRLVPDVNQVMFPDTQPKSMPQRTYLLNSLALFKSLNRKMLPGLAPLQMQTQIAFQTSTSSKALDPTKAWEWDDKISEKFERALATKVKYQIRTAHIGWSAEKKRMLVPLAEVEDCLSDIALFIKSGDRMGSVTKLHDRDCFEVEDLFEDSHGQVFGLTNDRRTLGLRIMLEKLFTYREFLKPVTSARDKI